LRQNIAFLNATLAANVNDKRKRQAHMRFEAFIDQMNNWVAWDTKEQYFAVGRNEISAAKAPKAVCVPKASPTIIQARQFFSRSVPK
jgi:hypothetical protein